MNTDRVNNALHGVYRKEYVENRFTNSEMQ